MRRDTAIASGTSRKVKVHEPEPQAQESENEAQTGVSFDVI